MLLTAFAFVGGAALLIVGAELLVQGASRLAGAAGVPPLVVGLTVVAFGTSAPEMAVTVGSAASGEPHVALGNVVGSNVFNVLFILGVSALITPLAVSNRLVRVDVPLVIGASVLTLLLSLDGRIGRLDGALLVAGVVAYTGFFLFGARRHRTVPRHDGSGPTAPPRAGRWFLDIGAVVAGLVGLVLGARWFVDAATTTASALGMSELVIGLTIVAAGTSLPEVATSILASIHGQRDIAVGNVLGSNLFNLLAVLGLGSLVAPSGLPVPPGALTFDLPIMIAVALLAWPLLLSRYTISRWEGAVLLVYYGAYVAWLVSDGVTHGRRDALQDAITWFVVPLTALTLIAAVSEWNRERRGHRNSGP